MKIADFLMALQGYTEYIASLQEIEDHPHRATRWDYILGVFGPTPVLWPCGDHGRVLSPLQAVAMGWDDCHNWGVWSIRPDPDYIQKVLELTAEAYHKIDQAIHLTQGYHPRLRADLIKACGMPSEAGTPFFEGRLT